MSAEAIVAACYAGALLGCALILEWLSAHTYRRSQRYRTAGFEYSEQHDAWVCPEGEHLWLHEHDRERRLIRYRGKAHVCNACPVKEGCTDSDEGREIVQPMDPWPHSEAGRFHRVISLMLVALAAVVALVALIRNRQAADIATLGTLIFVSAGLARILLRDLRRHPANFPEPAPSRGLDRASQHRA